MLFIKFETTIEGNQNKVRNLSFPVSAITKIDHDKKIICIKNFRNGKGEGFISLTNDSFDAFMDEIKYERSGFFVLKLKNS